MSELKFQGATSTGARDTSAQDASAYDTFSQSFAHPLQTVAPLKVLVIEDDKVDAAYLARVLDKLPSFKPEVEVVSEAREIRRALRRFSGDLIIADLMLDGDTSISYLSELNGQPDRAPVLLLTGMDGTNVQEMAFRAGVDAFISKSDLEPRLLETLVRTALHTSEMRRKFMQSEFQRNRELCQSMASYSAGSPVNDMLTGLKSRMSLHRSFR